MEDITEAIKLAKSTPKEAADNINESKMVQMTPDDYVESKPEMKPIVETKLAPTEVTRGVAGYANENSQQASIVKTDGEKLSYYERYIKYADEKIFDVPSNQRKMSEITDKYFTDDEVTSHDEMTLRVLNRQSDEYNKDDFGITGTWEQLPVHIASSVGEVWRGIENNKALIATIIGGQTAAGAGSGALIGSAAGGVGAVPGAVAGAGAGFISGLGNAALGAGFLDSYKETRNGLFNELSRAVDSDGKSLKLSLDTRKKVAIGVGMIGGIVNGALGKFLIKRTPFLNKFASPKQIVKLINNPVRRAQLEALGNMGWGSVGGAGGAAVIEAAKIIGTELATEGETEESFFSAIERISKAGLIGAGTGAAISGGLNAVGIKGNIKRYREQNKFVKNALGPDRTIVVDEKTGNWNIEKIKKPKNADTPPEIPAEQSRMNKAVKVLESQDIMNEMAALASSTEIKQVSKGEFSNIKKALFKVGGIDKNVYMHLEDLRRFSTDDEKGQAAKDMINKLGIDVNAAPNAPLQIPFREIMEMVEEYPEASDYVRMQADAPNPLEAKNYLERLEEGRTAREEGLKSLGIDKEPTPEQISEIESALEPIQEATESLNEYQYLDTPTFTSAIEGVLSDKEVQQYNTAYLDAKLAVSERSKVEVKNKIRLENEKLSSSILDQEGRVNEKALQKDLETVEYFNPKNLKNKSFKNALKKNHKKKGYSPFAIDPIHIHESIREAMVNEPMLKKRKMFVEGGLTPEEAASHAQLDSGQELIKLMANTPDRKDVVKGTIARKNDVRNQVEQGLKEENSGRLDEVYTQKSKLHRREMEFMMKMKQTQTKKGIKKIALPLPRIESINRKAFNLVNSIKVKDLNPRRFEVGEARSQKKAVDHILKSEVEQAFKAKENAMFNNELIRESKKASKQIERNNKVFADIKKPNNVKVLKKTGLYNGVDEILDLWNLSPSRKGLSERGSFDKTVAKLIKEGKGDFDIPEKFNDVRESITDASVEQHTVIANTLKALLHQGKIANKLLSNFEDVAEARSIELIREGSRVRLEKHPDFNPKRAETAPSGTLSIFQEGARIMRTTKTIIDSAKSLAFTLDEEIAGGYHHETLIRPLVDKEIAKLEDIKSHVEWQKEGIELYGKDKFEKLWNEIVTVDEFADFPTLSNDGVIRKTHLMELMAYLGDPGGLERIGNYVSRKGEPMTPEKVLEVLNRELDEDDANFVQNVVVNGYQKFKESSRQLHIRTTGEDTTMIEGVPVTHRSITRPGGYYPVKTQATTDEVKAEKVAQRNARKFKDGDFSKAFGLSKVDDYSNWASSRMTNQDRFNERSNNTTAPLKLNLREGMLNGVEKIIHDENFREVGIDLEKIYADPTFVKNIKSVIGPESYRVLYNSTFELVGRMTEDTSFFSEQHQWLNNLVLNAKVGLAIGTMAYSASSVTIQAASIPNLTLRMGKGGRDSVLSTLSILGRNIDKLPYYIDLANEVNPKIKFGKDRIDSTLNKSTNDLIPKELSSWGGKSPNVRVALKKAQNKVNDVGMSGMSYMDDFTKLVGTLSSIEHFTSGKAKNFPMDKLNKMTEAEKAKAMKSYVQQITESSLTSNSELDKTPPEKLGLGKLHTNFYADARNALTSQIATARKAKWKGKQSWEEVRREQWREAAKQASGMIKEVFAAVSVTATIALMIDSVRQEETPLTDLGSLTSAEDYQERAKQVASYILKSPYMAATDQSPIIRDIKYGASSKRRSDYKSVSIPYLRSMTDVATSYNAWADYFEDLIDVGPFDAELDLSKTQLKATGFVASYALGGIPVNGPAKFMKFLESDTAETIGNSITREAERLYDVLEDFTVLFKDSKKYEDEVHDAEMMKKHLIKEGRAPDAVVEIMKDDLIAGDWNFYDEKTGRAGKYGFTEERWKEIMVQEPSLGITENGRVSKDTSEQEIAMDWSIEDHVKNLSELNIPISQENITGVHELGFNNYVTEKIKD